MNDLAAWSSKNRLVQRVRRHGALATLFRSSLPIDSRALYSSPRLVLGQFGQVQAGDGWASAATAASPAALVASAVQLSPEVAMNVAARETLAGAQVAVNSPLPTHRQNTPPHQMSAIQPGALQTPTMSLASMASTAPALTTAVTADDQSVSSLAQGEDDQTWRRLQRIRQLHAQKLTAVEATPSDMVARSQRTPALPQSSASPQSSAPALPPGGFVAQPAGGSSVSSAPIPAAAVRTSPPADDRAQKQSAQSLSTPPTTRSHDPGAAMRSAITTNQAVQNQPMAAPAVLPLAARVIDPVAGQVLSPDAQNDLARDAADRVSHSYAAGDGSAPVGRQVPVAATLADARTSVAGASEKHRSDPSASLGDPDQLYIQRAPLEAAWPVIDDNNPIPVGYAVESVQQVGTASALSTDESNDGYAVDAVRQQVAKIETQVATDSRVDVITPRRPPPSARKASVSSQPDTVHHEAAHRELAQPAPVSNLTQRAMVETEIGALPADLWRLIGEEAPVGNDRTQPVAHPQDVCMAETASPVDPAIMEQVQHSATTASEAQHPTLRTDEHMAMVSADHVVDDLTAIGRSEVAQLAAATPAAVSGKRQDESPLHRPTPNSQSPISVGVLSKTAGATQRSGVADEIFAEQGESTQSRDSIAASDRSDTDKSSNAARMAPDAALIQVSGYMQTAQLAPMATALQSMSHLDVDVAAMSMAEAAGRQGQIDVDDLAQKVYRQLRRKLALEWERLRPVRY